MSALKKNLINRDHADKSWLPDDFDQHWTEPVKTTSPSWIVFSILLLTAITVISVKGW